MYKVYKITNSINNKVYIGITKQTLKQRLRNHKYVVRPDYIQWINNKTGNVDAIRRTNEVTKVKENYIRKGLKER